MNWYPGAYVKRSTPNYGTCIYCPEGTYRAGENTCQYGTGDVDDCTSCPPGTYNQCKGSTSLAACKTCPAGTYSVGRQNPCTSRPAGTYNPSTGTRKKTREEEEEAMTKFVSRNETERGGVEEKRVQREAERDRERRKCKRNQEDNIEARFEKPVDGLRRI
jgi:hypothetical protein